MLDGHDYLILFFDFLQRMSKSDVSYATALIINCQP